MAEEWTGPTERLDEFRYLIPRSYKPSMRTDGLIFADAKMMEQVKKDHALEQVANVATMPGIVGRATFFLHTRKQIQPLPTMLRSQTPNVFS